MYSSGETHFGMGTVVKVKKTNYERNSLSSRYKVVLLVLALAVNLTQLRVNGGISIGRLFEISLSCGYVCGVSSWLPIDVGGPKPFVLYIHR